MQVSEFGGAMVGECFDLCPRLRRPIGAGEMQVFEGLGRSRRDRGAELLDGLLARVAGTRTAGKYDLDVAHFAKTR